jgi:hypothetical protein
VKQFVKKLVYSVASRFSKSVSAERYRLACRNAPDSLCRSLPRVDAYLSAQKSGGLHSDHTEFKLLELWQTLERMRPRTIVECGSGATTCVFAEYAAQRSGVTVLSLENGAQYLEETKSRMPAELRGIPTMVHAPRVIEPDGSDEVCYYEPNYLAHLVPTVDLVYVDGPYNVSPTRPGKDMPCVDAIRLLEQGFDVEHILFDNRLSSVRQFMRSRFATSYDSRLGVSALGLNPDPWKLIPARHHSHFWRRSATPHEAPLNNISAV